jgi:uncharacterized membrane protein
MTEDTEGKVYVRRPAPARVREIGERLRETNGEVHQHALVAAIQRETGCSRATAYRAVQDFLEQEQLDDASH